MLTFSKIDEELSVYQNNKVVIYGAGIDGKRVKSELEQLGIKVDYFCDNDPEKRGKDELGIKVINHSELLGLASENMIVQVATRKFEAEIIQLLKKDNFSYIS